MYGWRARLGNISPSAVAEIFPYEFYRAAPEGVTLVTTNLAIRDARDAREVEASWQKMEEAIDHLIKADVSYMTLGGAPLVLAKGVPAYRQLLDKLRRLSPVPAGTSVQAFADGLKKLQAKRLAVATSFIPAHNELVKEFLVSEGFEVLGVKGLDTGLISVQKATLSPVQVYRHAKHVAREYPECDALLITSSAWPTLTVIQALEEDIGKPVVSSAVAQIWAPLYNLGIRSPIKGYGILLSSLASAEG